MTLLNNHFTNTKFAPTHLNADDDTVIDLALTSHPHMLQSMAIMSTEIIESDHYPLKLTFNITQAQIMAQQLTHTLTRQRARAQLFGGASVPVVPVPAVPSVPPVPPLSVPPLPVHIVRASPGRGLGLFSTQHLKKGSFVAQYTGEIIDEAEKKRRFPDVATRGVYVVYCKQNVYIDARNPDPSISSAARYIKTANKTEKNNVAFKISFRNGVPTVNVRTTRAIPAGTEFRISYGRGYFFVEDNNNTNNTNNNNTIHNASSDAHVDEKEMD